MQEIDMSSTAAVPPKVENNETVVENSEVGLNNISDSSINSSRGSAESTDSNNSSNRSTPSSSNVSLGDAHPPPINDKPKYEEEEEGEEKDKESAVSGGQLKFFKDGMLCLQLAHQNAGPSSKWVQIRTRTVFPPLVQVTKEVSIPCQLSPAPNSFSGIPSRVENSSTSRSVSDDGSSILSSPVLRESSTWKQQVPRKGASNVSLQFFMTPAPCIIRRRKVLYHKFPRLTRQPYNLFWMKKFASCTIVSTTQQSKTINETEPVECLECKNDDQVVVKNTPGLKSSSEGEEEVDGDRVIISGSSETKPPISENLHQKKKLSSCINRLSVQVEKSSSSSSQVNSDNEQMTTLSNNNNGNTNGGDLQHNIGSSKTPIKNIRVSSLPPLAGNCRDLKNNSSAFTIRPKATDKRSKMNDKDRATILSVPLTAAKLLHHHQSSISDRRDLKDDAGGGKSKKFKKEKFTDQLQRQKLTMSSPQKSHSSSTSSGMNERKNLQNASESMALNLSSSNRQCFTPPSDMKPFNLSLPDFANQLYPINYLSVLAASSTAAAASSPSALNSSTNFPNYSSAGFNLQQQLLQQHAMQSVISDTVNCLLAANKVSNNNSSDRIRRDLHKESKGHSLNLVQDSSSSGLSLLKKMQHKSKTKKSSHSNFKVPDLNTNSSLFSSNVKSNSNKLLYFGNNSREPSLLETTSSSSSSSSSSPLPRNNNIDSKQNSFLRNLLDTSYPIPSSKFDGRDILKNNASIKSHPYSSSKTTSNAGAAGNMRAKSHQNAKLKSNILNNSVPPLHPPLSHSKSSSSKFSSRPRSNSTDRDRRREKSSSSLNNSSATNILSQLSSQRSSSSDLPRHHDPMEILRGSSSTAAAFNSLVGHPGLLSGFPSGMAVAAAAAAYLKNPPANDFNSLLSGMPSFDYGALNSFLPFPTTLFDAVGGGRDAFRLHPTSLASSLPTSSATSISSDSSSKFHDSGSDAPLNLCKKSRPN